MFMFAPIAVYGKRMCNFLPPFHGLLVIYSGCGALRVVRFTRKRVCADNIRADNIVYNRVQYLKDDRSYNSLSDSFYFVETRNSLDLRVADLRSIP